MNNTAERLDLLKRGWTAREIEQAMRILQEAPGKRSTLGYFLDVVISWLAFFVILIGSFVISVFLIPYIMLVPNYYLFPGIFFVALTFGALFSLITWDVQKIEETPRFNVGLYFFFVAIINITIINALCFDLARQLNFNWPMMKFVWIGISYVAGFMLPYAVLRSSKKLL